MCGVFDIARAACCDKWGGAGHILADGRAVAVCGGCPLCVHNRHDGANYIFSLLTGYRDAPHGVECGEGQYYNPYFPGGKIGMPKLLEDGGVEYQDGTPATASQMAKDVAEFLVWTAEPDHNDRRVSVVLHVLVGQWCGLFEATPASVVVLTGCSGSGRCWCCCAAHGPEVDVLHGCCHRLRCVLQALPLGTDQGPQDHVRAPAQGQDRVNCVPVCCLVLDRPVPCRPWTGCVVGRDIPHTPALLRRAAWVSALPVCSNVVAVLLVCVTVNRISVKKSKVGPSKWSHSSST